MERKGNLMGPSNNGGGSELEQSPAFSLTDEDRRLLGPTGSGRPRGNELVSEQERAVFSEQQIAVYKEMIARSGLEVLPADTPPE